MASQYNTQQNQTATLSSAARLLSFIRRWNLRKLFVPIGWISRTRHSAVSWGRDNESRVISSSNSLENFIISSLVARSPVVRTCGYWKHLKKHSIPAPFPFLTPKRSTVASFMDNYQRIKGKEKRKRQAASSWLKTLDINFFYVGIHALVPCRTNT